MEKNTKRKCTDPGAPTTKKPRVSTELAPSATTRDLLEQLYPTVKTLRDYLLSKLPASSRLRRKKIASLSKSGPEPDSDLARLVHLLDTTLVGTGSEVKQDGEVDTRWQQYLSFSQKGDESNVTISGSPESFTFSLSEIIDFVIWLIFSRQTTPGSWPKHLLCDGFRKGPQDTAQNGTSIPGVYSRFPNPHVHTLKEAPWTQVLALLGQSGERIMVDLLLDSSIFVAVPSGLGNYYQVSGISIAEIDPASKIPTTKKRVGSKCRNPSEITLVRSRMLYAKPNLTSRGLVQTGFKHIHVLNRCPLVRVADQMPGKPSSNDAVEIKRRNKASTVKVMMYIFPRQFKLHNVFTSDVDSTKTTQKFQDYTLRETEISSHASHKPESGHCTKIPRRLRGDAENLVMRLQVRHARCSYFELLTSYCPSFMDQPFPDVAACQQPLIVSSDCTHQPRLPSVQPNSRNFPGKKRRTRHIQRPASPAIPSYDTVADLATPTAHVSAFCQAVVSKVVPNGFWGDGSVMLDNKKVILRKVDHFVRLRRFETMSLHEIIQGLKVVDIPWLRQPNLEGSKASRTDIEKRYELLHEFLYYVFDSLIIPLIRNHFYVTESSTDRMRLFYFRHDVWKRIAEPAMGTLREKMFEDIKLSDAARILNSRRSGYSRIRLLPKGPSLRPIMNLRKRTMAKHGSKALKPSINTFLAPVHTFLKFEKGGNPEKLGSTLFSVSDIYVKLKDFKTSLGADKRPLYMAKLDVHAAFDTIPQEAVVRLMASVPRQASYTVAKHMTMRPGERTVPGATNTATRPTRRWHSAALGSDGTGDFADRLMSGMAARTKNTVFVGTAGQKTYNTMELLQMLSEHVKENLVKIGKKYYRQKTGIPQGSILSSYLCNYFYADLEIRHLSFINDPECLLLRLIDDFLLITPDQSKAVRFVETMHRGIPDYGVQVNPKKTLVNFDMHIPGAGKVNKIDDGERFPYCGTRIDCHTLDITRDREKSKKNSIVDSLTVDFGRSPGQNFARKVLHAFQIQSHFMFFDTEHNSTATVLQTLHDSFSEVASKMLAYIRCLPKSQRPKSSLIIRTVSKVIDVAFLLLRSKSRRMLYEQYICDVRRAQVVMTGYRAFLEALNQRQTGYNEVIEWLQDRIQSSSAVS